MEKKKTPWYDNIEKAIIIVLFLVMLAVLFCNVVTRFCFSYTPSWAEQAARILFVWMSFAGTSLAGMTGSHLQVTAASMVVGEKRFNYILWIGDIIVVLFGLFMAYKIYGVMMTVMASGQTFPTIRWLPSWVLYFPGVMGMLGLSARIIQKRVRYIRARRAAADKEVQA